MAGSSLFHSMIADEKKLFLKKLCYVNFIQGNTINISRSIRRCKKTSIFENFLVVESFFLSNYRLTAQSSDYKLNDATKNVFLEIFRLDCSQAVVHSHTFLEVSPENAGGGVLFWSNYRLAFQSSDYILKWLHQECFVGNSPKDFGAPKYHRL